MPRGREGIDATSGVFATASHCTTAEPLPDTAAQVQGGCAHSSHVLRCVQPATVPAPHALDTSPYGPPRVLLLPSQRAANTTDSEQNGRTSTKHKESTMEHSALKELYIDELRDI